MASSKDYFVTLRVVRDYIGRVIGVNIPNAQAETRWTANANLAVVSAVVKILVDKGLITEADLQTAFTAAETGSDGSDWTNTDGPTPPADGSLTFDDFEGEDYEFTSNGTKLDETNTSFLRGQVGTSLLSANGSVTCDSSVHQGGTKSGKTVTSNGWSRALRTATYAAADQVYTKFYFKAAAAPASDMTIFAWQWNPNEDPDPDATFWRLTVRVDSTGKPTMVENGNVRNPGTGTAPNICNNAMWRVDVGFYGVTCEIRLWTGANIQGTGSADFTWTSTYSTGAANSAVLGQPRSTLTSGQSWTCWHDDVTFSTTGFPPPV